MEEIKTKSESQEMLISPTTLFALIDCFFSENLQLNHALFPIQYFTYFQVPENKFEKKTNTQTYRTN